MSDRDASTEADGLELGRAPQTDEEKNLLRRALGRSMPFASALSSEVDIFVEQCRRVEVPASKTVVQQGDQGHCFFVVESGKCDILTDNDDDDEHKKNGSANGGVPDDDADADSGKLVGVVGPTNTFGETSILHGVPRTATVRAHTDTVLWALCLDHARMQAQLERNERATAAAREQIRRIVSQHDTFSVLDDGPNKGALIDSFFRVELQPGETVVRRGNYGDNFYIIESGMCEEVDDDGQVETLLLPGECFGQSLLVADPYSSTVRAHGTAPVVLWALSRSLFHQILEHGCTTLREHFDTHASLTLPNGERAMTLADLSASFSTPITNTANAAVVRHRPVQEVLDLLAVAAESGLVGGAPGTDHTVEFADYLQFVFLLGGPEPHHSFTFRLLDRTRSGTISLPEFRTALELLVRWQRRASGQSAPVDSAVAVNIPEEVTHKWFGADGSRALSYQEFQTLVSSAAVPAVLAEAMNSLQELATVAAVATPHVDAVDEALQLRRAVEHKSLSDVAADYFAGGFSGAVSRTCVSPLERLKILFMVGHGGHQLGVVGALRKILHEEGWRGMFRGNNANVIRIFPYEAAKLGSFSQYKTLFARLWYGNTDNAKRPHTSQELRLPAGLRFLAGVSAGVTATLISYPLDFVRARLSLPSHKVAYRGVWHGLSSVARADGFFGLYRGLGITLCGIMPYAGVQLSVYDFCKQAFREWRGCDPSRFDFFVAGAFASTVAQTVAFPIELARRRLQVDGFADKPQYKGAVDVFRKILATDGWRGLYRGLMPNYLKIVPASGISFLVYEQTKLALGVRTGAH